MLPRTTLIASCLLLTACMGDSSSSPEPTKSIRLKNGTHALEALARKAVAAQTELAEIRNSQSPERNDVAYVTPPELQRTVSRVKWAGKLSIIAHDLAKEAGYFFKTQGNPSDVIVTINWEKDITLIDAFADLGRKSGREADLVVIPSIGTVIVQYD